MNGRNPQQLQSLLENHFDMSELRQLTFSLGIDHENLEGNNKRDFILSLIRYAQRHNLIEELNKLVEKDMPVRQQSAQTSFLGRMSFGTKVTIVSIVVTIISIIIALIGFFPEVIFGNPATAAPPSDNQILLQVQVNSAVDQSPIANATVRLDVAGQLFAPQRTDSNGRAVFELSDEIGSDLARLTVEYAGYEIETQNIELEPESILFEFQLRPLP